MNEDEARKVERMLRQAGRAGYAAPVDPADPSGPWCIYDRPGTEGRRDITAEALDHLIDRQDTSVSNATLPAGGQPARGFIFPGMGDSQAH